MKRIKVTALDVSKPLISLLAINILVLGLWTGLSPLVWVRETVAEDDFGNPTISIGQCTSNGALPFVITLVVVDIGAMVFALYQAYLARRIALEFAETTYILNSILCILLVCFVGIPVIIIASDDPRARFFLVSCIIFVICTSLLLFIFVPKEKFRRNNEKGATIKQTLRGSWVSRLSKKPNEVTESATSSNMISSTSSTDSAIEGLRVLSNPKAIADLEEEVAALKIANSNLEKEMKKLLDGADKTSVSFSLPEAEDCN